MRYRPRLVVLLTTARESGPRRLLCTAWAAVGLAVVLGGCQSGGFWKKDEDRGPSGQASVLRSDMVREVKPEQKADIQMAIARTLESDNKPDQAIRAYQEVLSKNPRRADAHHRLAMLYGTKGDAEKAEKHYQAALKLAPKDAEVYCDRGYTFYLQRRWGEAESSLRKALQLKPDLARAHNNLGLLLARTDRQADALAEFARAGCTEAQAHTNLAFALTLEADWDGAQREYQAAIAADPQSPQAQEGLKALAAVQQSGTHRPVAYQARR